jgi:hypothetical protein
MASLKLNKVMAAGPMASSKLIKHKVKAAGPLD